MASLKQISSVMSFSGLQKVYEHQSEVLKCAMKFAIYLPPLCETKKVNFLRPTAGYC